MKSINSLKKMIRMGMMWEKINLDNYSDKISLISCLLEFNIDYPGELHDLHDYL